MNKLGSLILTWVSDITYMHEFEKGGKGMKVLIFTLAIGILIFALTGCSVNTKLVERERVDQEISPVGNQGYLFGTPPPAIQRKATREYFEVQVEVPPVIERESRVPKKEEGVRGTPIYSAPEIPEKKIGAEKEELLGPETAKEEYTDYTVQKGETLQKISKKFYGTTKKWRKIFSANQDKLKTPDKVYPGQVLKIPQEAITPIEGSEYIK